MIREHDTVVLTSDLPAHGLARGDVGTVVMVHAVGGYEVEFMTLDGVTIAVVSLAADEIRPIGRREMKEVMGNLKREGRKIFLNTHILADVHEICDEVGIVHQGKLLYAGGVTEFCAGKPLEERFMEVVDAHEALVMREQ